MRLRTLGRVALEHVEFTRPKPLLLLAYLALEGRRDRRHVAELFWPGAADRMKSLTVALARLRKGAPGVIDADDAHVWATVEADAERFLAQVEGGMPIEALELYRGPFLDGFYLRAVGAELEEWIYQTREHLAGRARHALLELAERRAARERYDEAAAYAAEAHRLSSAPAPEPDELERLHTLLCAGRSPHASTVRDEARDVGLDLVSSAADARDRLRKALSATVARAPHDLPRRSTAFVGRDVELTEVATLISRPDCPLLTLVGPPGVGKTRLAVQVAREQHRLGAFPDGISFVPLEALGTARSLTGALADALGLRIEGSRDPIRSIAARIGSSDMLLVLDDAEAILGGARRGPPPGARDGDAAPALGDIAMACPGLTLLVTSRERLNLEEERVFPVGGLPYPADDATTLEEAQRFDGVKLFLRRARRARPDLVISDECVAGAIRVCRLVEGLPLALELAAAWARMMRVDEIASALEEGLDLLERPTRTPNDRHRSMRASFDRSWRLLGGEERRVMRALSVLGGSFRREAAAAVAGATIPVLGSLVDASQLRVDPAGRYDRHPLLREYARERLEEEPAEAARARAAHRGYYLGLLRAREGDLAGGAHQREAIALLEGEIENVLLAWRRAADVACIAELWDGCRPLQLFLIQRGGLAREGAEAFAGAAERLDASDPGHGALLGRLLVAEAWFRYLLGDIARSSAAAERGVGLLRACDASVPPGAAAAGDAAREAVDRALTSGLNTLGNTAKHRGELRLAERFFGDALGLARARGDEAQVAIMTNNLALLHKAMGDYREAERLHLEALAINRSRRNARSVVRNLTNLGGLMVVAGEFDAAERLLREGRALAEEIGYDAIVSSILVNSGGAAFARGGYAEASARFREALERERESGERLIQADASCHLGRAEAAQGHYDEARRHLRTALELAWDMQYAEIVCESLLALAELHLDLGHREEAAAMAASIRQHPALTHAASKRLEGLLEELAARPSPGAPLVQLEREAGPGLERMVASALHEAPWRP